MYEHPFLQLRLAVCDDEPAFSEQVVAWTREILRQEGIDADIERFDSARTLLETIEAGADFSILLLDVMMEGMDGMELAAALRTQGRNTPIIFISSNREMALRGYEVAAVRYLAKPLDREKLREALLHCCGMLSTGGELLLPDIDGHRRIQSSSLMFAETYGRGIRIVLQDGQFESRMKISELAAMLPSAQYVFCHRTILVNLDFVISIRYCELELKNGVHLPISKYRLNELRTQLLRYLER
ncbi:MAG: LytTR family DNA-binding domain-containing protein [Clostridiales bacterium]|nr:LytTR family DNA-binding domain-containing protein [Clostridiales bacterium]